MLIAAKSVLVALGIEPGKLFLSGWSQGGWTTMAYLEKLEGLGLPVTAAAVASGPVDIALTFGRWLNNPQPVDAPYLPAAVAILLHADANYHQVPGLAESAIAPEYVDAARALYERTGFVASHPYHYRVAPPLPSTRASCGS